MDYRPAPNQATTQYVYKITGSISPGQFDKLNSQPVEIIPQTVGVYYNVLGFSLELGSPTLGGQLFPFMLRQTGFSIGTYDSIMMLKPKLNGDTGIITASSFSGFFNGATGYINASTNSEPNYGVYLTSIADEGWDFQKESYFSVIYTIETYHS